MGTHDMYQAEAAENERLRVALLRIENFPVDIFDAVACLRRVKEIAGEALREEE